LGPNQGSMTLDRNHSQYHRPELRNIVGSGTSIPSAQY